MEFPDLINWTNRFRVKALMCSIQILTVHAVNSAEPDQTPQNAASDLVLHFLLKTHKRGAWLKWVKQYQGDETLKRLGLLL